MERVTTSYDVNPVSSPRSIREWRVDEQPRERLRRHGATTLSDSELLAVILGTGTRGVNALDAARLLLNTYGSLDQLLRRDVSEFCAVPGIGPGKALSLVAAFELSRRLESAPFDTKRVVRNAKDIANYYIPLLRGALHESFRALHLNSANQVVREIVVSEGSLNASIVHPREVFRRAITESAASIIVLHNHPSGNTEPSREDLLITKQLKEAGAIIDIKVLDHIIIAGDQFTSFAERGLM